MAGCRKTRLAIMVMLSLCRPLSFNSETRRLSASVALTVRWRRLSCNSNSLVPPILTGVTRSSTGHCWLWTILVGPWNGFAGLQIFLSSSRALPAVFGYPYSLSMNLVSSSFAIRPPVPTGGCSFADGAEPDVTFWHPSSASGVLAVEASSVGGEDEDAFDVRRFKRMAVVLRLVDGAEHVLFSDGERHLQLMVTAGTVLSGPVRLRCTIIGFRFAEDKLLAFRRLLQLNQFGRMPRQLYPPNRRAPRWVEKLRAYDGLRAGASHREIAAVLLGEQQVRQDWAGRSDYLRLRIQRLVREAWRMVRGGYRDLLR